jgi:hypothetical protein
MKHEDKYIPLDPEDVTNCPQATKDYMLKKGFMPYKGRNGRVRWINKYNRTYRNHKGKYRHLIYSNDMFGNKVLKKWVKTLIYAMIIVIAISFLVHRLGVYDIFFS